ncbi:MAG: CDP-alcohol phosphatidyltransferase family protein [Parachlamydiales bacterium]|nr:CDP-alcohol phosphatidyltransferase family protein [Parachlamydiales bacterium]
MMFTISNVLSFIRAPLALLFLMNNSYVRLGAVILAMITDSIDGYVARRSRSTSKFGVILDPAMDKFFVFFVLSRLFFEDKIRLWEILAMISRDFALALFGMYLIATKKYKGFTLHPIRWGKISTAMQFCVIIGLTLGLKFSWYVYGLFIAFAAMAFLELFTTSPSNAPNK